MVSCKRLLLLFLCVIFAGISVTGCNTTLKVEDSVPPIIYNVDNATRLVELAKLVEDNGSTFDNCIIRLTQDIDMKGIPFNGFRREYKDMSEYFVGTFDGNNKTISNMVINLPNADYVGLIGAVSPRGRVINVIIDNTSSVTGKNYVGGVVGGNWGYIGKSTNAGAVTGIDANPDIDNRTGNSVGGIVGTNGGNVNNLGNTGSVIGSGNSIGGIAGDNSGSVHNVSNGGSVNGAKTFVGGITGTNSGSIDNASNIGEITGFDSVGGIAGYSRGSVGNIYSIGEVIATKAVGSNKGGTVGVNSANGKIKKGYFLQTTDINKDLIPQNGETVKGVDGFSINSLGFSINYWEDKTFEGKEIINGVATRAVIKFIGK